MFDFIGAFLDVHYWTVSYTLTYILSTICGITLLSRFARMFPTYIKTGSMGDSHLGIFFSNSQYRDTHGWDFVRAKVRDFFTSTHLEPIIMDALVCAVAIGLLHFAWIVIAVIGSIIGFIYGIVKFVVYLRERHVKKEEFYTALKGD